MIVKVQRSLFPANAPALVYNRDRSFLTHVELPDDVVKKMGKKPKAYFLAEMSGTVLVLDRMMPDQPW